LLSLIGKRIITTLPVIWGVVTIVFLIIHMIPGDPIEIMLGEQALSSEKEVLRQQLGLDRPIAVQYLQFLKGLATFDLGESIYTGEAVTKTLLDRYPATLQLTLASMFVAILIAIPLGIIAAARKGTWVDTASMLSALVGVSMPNFWLGPLLILVFAYKLDLFPVSGRYGFSSIILPAITLGTALAAILTRMIRSTILDVIHQDYIRVARAKGLAMWKVYSKHAFKNALLPVITIVGLQFGALLAGAIITEKIFSWPGLGLEIVEAIQKRDYPMVQGCVLAISLSYVFINFLTDLMYGAVDPRARVDS
jgi:peptide/nickel transport system permease protein